MLLHQCLHIHQPQHHPRTKPLLGTSKTSKELLGLKKEEGEQEEEEEEGEGEGEEEEEEEGEKEEEEVSYREE